MPDHKQGFDLWNSTYSTYCVMSGTTSLVAVPAVKHVGVRVIGVRSVEEVRKAELPGY